VGEQPELADGTGARYCYPELTQWEDDALPSPVVVPAWGHQLGVPDTATRGSSRSARRSGLRTA